MELERGTQVDRYVVDSVIGFGGMAAVYKVLHTKLQTPYALKVLTVSSRSIEQRLLREGRVQASLRHPNIVSVIDVVDIRGATGLVMEFVEGPSLDDILSQRRLTVDQVLSLAFGIVSGVRAAHKAGFVHRDLKPANVMLQMREASLQPKVADFGLAKLVAGDDGIGSTRTGVTMGTACYMAPEQIRNAKGVDHRADIFALGCILYEMATGQRTYPGDDMLEIFMHISQGTYVDPVQLSPHMPEPLLQVIRDCLEVDLDKRVGSCDQILDVIRACGDGEDPKASLGFTQEFLESARSLSESAQRSDVASGGATDTWSGGGDFSVDPESDDALGYAPTMSVPDDHLRPSEDRPRTAPPPSEPAPVDQTNPTLGPPETTKDEARSVVPRAGMSAAIAAGGFAAGTAVAMVGLVAVVVGGLALWWYLSQDKVADTDQQTTPSGTTTGTKTGAAPTGTDGGGDEGSEEPDPERPVQAPPPKPAVDCSDLTKLEGRVGKLTTGESRCLEGRVKDESIPQTDRVVIGDLMLADAKAKCTPGKACKDWEAKQLLYFDKVTRSEAERMYGFSQHVWDTHGDDLSRVGLAVQWAKYALQQKHQWEGPTHIKRVDALYEIIARGEGLEFSKGQESARVARDTAVEWANFRLKVGKPDTPARELCVRAADLGTCQKRITSQPLPQIEVVIASQPPSTVIEVDGQRLEGGTPLKHPFTVGSHQLRLTLQDGSTATTTIEVDDDQPKRWTWNAASGKWETGF